MLILYSIRAYSFYKTCSLKYFLTVKTNTLAFDMKILKSRRRRGFTLVEMLVVVGVIGILMSVLFVSFRQGNLQGKTDVLQLKAAKAQLDLALFQYRQTFGSYPSTSDGLAALVEAPSGVDASQYPAGGFLASKKFLLDPWKEPYHYELKSDGSYEISTLGQDKQSGGEGSAADIYFSQLE